MPISWAWSRKIGSPGSSKRDSGGKKLRQRTSGDFRKSASRGKVSKQSVQLNRISEKGGKPGSQGKETRLIHSAA